MVRRSRLSKEQRMRGMIGAVKSPKTPQHLKEGLIRKYPELKEYT